MIVAHPPCTYLTVTGNRWFNTEIYGDKAIQRMKDREDAVQFFMRFVNADCDRIAIENPIGYMSTHYRRPDQVIHPYQFGDPVRKATCLWLKNLPLLVPTKVVEPDIVQKDGFSMSGVAYYARDENGKILAWNDPRTARIRSKTYQGIADAIADQWGSQRYYVQTVLF